MSIDQLAPAELTPSQEASAAEIAVVPLTMPAGFPSPALDYVTETINLHENLVRHPASTFIARVTGSSMEGAGISDGDRVLVEKGREPQSGDVVIAVLEDQFTLKRLMIERGRVWLHAENPEYPDIEIPCLDELTIWGVVYMSLHHLP